MGKAGGDGPDECGQFAGDGDVDDIGGFARTRHTAMASAEA